MSIEFTPLPHVQRSFVHFSAPESIFYRELLERRPEKLPYQLGPLGRGVKE